MRLAPGIAVVFLAALAFAACGQYFAGVYASDLHWADEGSHYINGLLIHDYFAHGLTQNPVHYAIGYYANYPKVAIGHWPPFFYPLEAAFLFLTGPSTAAALFLQALFAAALAATVAAVVAHLHGWFAGAAAALVTLLAPGVFAGVEGVMLDVPLALFAFLATLCWAKYLDSGNWVWSLVFAFAAVDAILTKGNGYFLALLPPLSFILTRRFELLKEWSFWLPLPIVAVLTVPWYAVTYEIAADGFNYAWGLKFTAKALAIYGRVLFWLIGIPGLILAAAGATLIVSQPPTGWKGALGVSVLSAAIAGFAYHCLVPVALEPRYLTPLIPCLVVLAAYALEWPMTARWRLAGITVAGLVVVGAEARFPLKYDLGMARAAHLIQQSPSKSPFVLVGSSPGGEGAITAELASADRARTQYVVRGFQVLGTGNFMGTRYRTRFATPAALKDWIESNRIGWVVLDTSPVSLKWRHNSQLHEMLSHPPSGWQQLADIRSAQGSVLVYKVPQGFNKRVDVARLLPQLTPAKVIGRYHKK